jgi:gliding motility-associated lipoprotein GldH
LAAGYPGFTIYISIYREIKGSLRINILNKMKKSLLILIVVFAVSGCNSVYKEYEKDAFSGFTWEYGTEISFQPEIKENTKKYDVKLGLRYHHNIPSKKVGITVKTISPSGKETAADYEFILKDESNNSQGQCAGDICDLEMDLEKKFTFPETGVYKFVITHNEIRKRIGGILELGLIIENSKQ